MQNIDMVVYDLGFGSSPTISLHSHADSGLHEFHYFLDGDGVFWNGDLAWQVTPGTLVFSSPHEAHQAQTRNPGTKFLFYYALFTIEQDSAGLVSLVKDRFAGRPGLTIGRGYAPAFEEIRRRCLGKDPLGRRSADFRFLALLCDLAGNGPTPVPPPSTRYVDEALSLMQASIHSGLDLDKLAGRLGIDKSHFVRLFKRAVGVPPMRYFLGLRLDSAKHLLRNGEQSLRTIALELGFHDEFHFSHQFKTHVGQSPQSFRRQGV